jgi:NADPH-dependent 2,4-dienoyl-CoA reductase/sulfur reductase-like enzyme
MAAALELDRAGFSCTVLEREDHLGGILMQCVHNGFGVHEFDEELTGPEFAERFINKIRDSQVAVYLNTTVIQFEAGGERKELFCASPDAGVLHIRCRAVVLAMGCRERNRGNARIPGSRPAGIYTAGLAQRLVNIEGYIPGSEAVIIGSGDIGLIMARRLSWVGCAVKAVVEIMDYPAGLPRNIVQCVRDFNIPLYLSSRTTSIFGSDRVEGVEITPLLKGAPRADKRFRIDCDTVLLSVGLIPENELSKEAGIELNGATGGPGVDSFFMTSADGVFSCGNALHVHDLVDWVAEESRRAGQYAAQWLKGVRRGRAVRTKAGANVRYVCPGSIDLSDPEREQNIALRTLVVKTGAVLEMRVHHQVLRQVKKVHVQPSEMIRMTISAKDLEGVAPDSVVEFSVL